MMKKFNSFNTKKSAAAKAVLSAGILSFALAGCGSDGKDGENGEDGVVGVQIDSAKSVNVVFTDAAVDAGAVTVNFSLENDNGVAVLGLTKDHDLRFGIAQLAHVTETMNDNGGVPTEYDRGFQWQAYINSQKEPGSMPDDTSHLDPKTQFQANVEKASDCETCFVDNDDGTYTYTFQQNIGNVTTPVEVVYNADYSQRATLELELPNFAANANYDWQPSTGTTEGIQTREVVSIETCYTCHQPDSLEFHGGRRINLENCVSCHTATSGDPESGNSVDFTYMIHAIHKGNSRTTYSPDSPDADEKGNIPAPYKVIGYGGGVHDYGKVMYPQTPAADCAACHVTGETAPADAELFLGNKSNTACIACHTTMPKAYHDPSNENCISCHIQEGYARSAEEAHGDATKRYKESQSYSAKFSKVTVTDNVLTFDVQILDEQGQAVAKEFIANTSQYTKSSIYFSWDTDKDYPAYTDGTKYSARGFALLNTDVSDYNAETKTFSIDSTNSALELPVNLNGKSVELFAGVATCFKSGGYGRPLVEPTACEYDETDPTKLLTDAAYIQDAPLSFTWNDTDTSEPATARRDIIDSSKCMGCHNQEIVHYDNGVNCQTCHTSDKGLNAWGGNAPTSFAYKAHEAEGHYLKYAGVGSSTVVKTDCMTCHTDDGIKLGRAPERTWRYGDMLTGEDMWVSSDAGACMSCHQKYLSDSGKSHIETNGGILDGISAEDVQNRAKETCSTCHSPEKLMELHGN
ncbi:OmcA/MtrC family decaheme c-type cytochrome [Shewanella eurypsychrophilus]|uniref:OmcA/MtrC family decaheme c-type cytochrome n=1 Tax=Shewanella eurypsychrophilus TaxID=2593656 RepID=A0ABX6V643_9GAMM|nr:MULTISPECIES: OmcA/MtrC family decaheme c-type cytochrome [Shewanella]QFU22010.1 OmcA/MtrC family decaheme c-type cytochrome [Shewanella sp. YLB-09]QPG57299.1 OmcA/MtrC family decaheme c-type cytochrome [Shewanella eurypsychrophilus]